MTDKFTISITKDGEPLDVFPVSSNPLTAISAIEQEVEKYLAHGYKIIFEPLLTYRYVMASRAETIAIELSPMPADLAATRLMEWAKSLDETQPIEAQS